ncbi:S9 family peptidase [Microbacterium maritypicum]|uniref:prolyl oligopeptidase family serine peptidase n=1 Tax=Microbacterium maritypicum TaxID=33918 RepID=UPI001B31BECC|nr:prolyl oligopeptidase family serine peptidase [Microbacterium liquefaciens]MBP5803184.1 S9 family peptidase [Microbacterium liquefaciens]
MSAHRSLLDDALARAERHGRPGLPLGGFTLGRADDRSRRGIHRVDGTTVIEPDGHLHRIFPSPDRRLVAVEWAPSADENAVFGIVDVAAGTLRPHPDIRLRYDTVLWAADSRSLDIVASRDRMLVTLDLETDEQRAVAIEPDVRLRLFPGGQSGLRALSSGSRGTTLTDRATGASLGRWSALLRASPLDAEDPRTGVLVWHDGGLDAVANDGAANDGAAKGGAAKGGVLWHWSDPDAQIVDVAVHGDRVIVLAVADGRSVLIDLVDGVEIERSEAVSAGSDTLTTTAIGFDDGVLHLGVEGPLTPPRIVERTKESATIAPPPAETVGATVRHDLPADDGATLTVHVTAPPGAEGPVPLILTCYGGFGVPHLPLFEPTVPAWVAFGGAYASAQLRGGGERGGAWREAGRGARKHRTIADLADVARGLIAAGITHPDLLVLAGASLGGVIAAGCAIEHPELCAGFVTTAAPLDLLALDDHPLGARWRAEFGDDGTPESRARLRALSPLAQAEALPVGAPIPSYLGVVLGEDTRVLARDTHRMVEALQQAGGSARLWTAAGAGHGANESAALHALGLTVLDFAADVTTAMPADAPRGASL